MTDEGDNGRTLTCNVCGCTARNVCTHVAEGRPDLLAEIDRLRKEEKRFGKYIQDNAEEFRQMRQDRDDAQAESEQLSEEVSRVRGWYQGCKQSRTRWRGLAISLLERNRDLRKANDRLREASDAIDAIRKEITGMRSNVREALDYGDGALLDEARCNALEAIDEILKGTE
jgi:chromosome segregation ATPase